MKYVYCLLCTQGRILIFIGQAKKIYPLSLPLDIADKKNVHLNESFVKLYYRKHLQLSSDAVIFGAINNDGNFGWLPLRLLLPNDVGVAFTMAFSLWLLLLVLAFVLAASAHGGPLFPQVMLVSCSTTALLPLFNAFNEPLRKTAVAGINWIWALSVASHTEVLSSMTDGDADATALSKLFGLGKRANVSIDGNTRLSNCK